MSARSTATPGTDPLRAAFKARDVGALVRVLFGYTLTPTQQRIVRAIVYRESKRIIISAHTRYGKTRCVAIAVCLLILLDPRPLKIRLVGPRREQAEILKGYIAELIVASALLSDLVDFTRREGPERLKREVSKRRWTFKDGKDLLVISAEGTAARAMGQGGDVVVLDESVLLQREAAAKIMRMLGDSPDSVLVEMSNPWHRENHFYSHWKDSAYLKFHVPSEVGVAEGRVAQEWVDEMRRLDFSSTEAQVLLDSVFPDEAEGQLVSHAWIERATETRLALEAPVRVRFGLDVAEDGMDLSVLRRIEYSYKYGKLLVRSTGKWVWKNADTMQTAEDVASVLPLGAEVVVDCIGVGKGVADRLRRMGRRFIIREFKSSNKAREPTRFRDAGAEGYWMVRAAFEEERVELDPADVVLRAQLAQPRKDTDLGRIRVVKNPDGGKSPDHADAFMMAIHGGEAGKALLVG